MENKQKNKLLAKAERKQSLRYGGWLTVVAAMSLVLCVGINLLAGALPETVTQLDLSQNGLYTLSDTTEQILDGLQDDIVIYYLVETGAEDENIDRLLQVYDAHKKVSVVRKDPVLYPNFAAQYTEETVYGDSCIVVNQTTGRSRFVDYYSLYLMDDSEYYYTGQIYWSFGAENALTGAIDYVTAEKLPLIYRTTGHGELTLEDALITALDQDNMTLSDTALDLLTMEIPADCDTLLVMAPERDFAIDEANKLAAWLMNGGKLMLVSDYIQGEDFENLFGIMEAYYMENGGGVIMEGDSGSYLQGYPHYILPQIQDSDITAALSAAGLRVLTPMVQPLYVTDNYDAENSTVTVTPLLATSYDAYLKADPGTMTTTGKEEGDQTGSYVMAASAEAADTRICWFTGSMMFYEEVDQYVSGANYDLALAAFGWLTGHESSISIHEKSLDYSMLTVPTADANRINLTMVIAVPVICLAMGVLVTVKRRKQA